MTCQIDHFSNFEKDIFACRSVDCCRNISIFRTQYFIIFWTFDLLTSLSNNCNFSLICSRKNFLILGPISPVVEKAAGHRRRWLSSAAFPYFLIFCFSVVMGTCSGLLLLVRLRLLKLDTATSTTVWLPPPWGLRTIIVF